MVVILYDDDGDIDVGEDHVVISHGDIDDMLYLAMRSYDPISQ